MKARTLFLRTFLWVALLAALIGASGLGGLAVSTAYAAGPQSDTPQCQDRGMMGGSQGMMGSGKGMMGDGQGMMGGGKGMMGDGQGMMGGGKGMMDCPMMSDGQDMMGGGQGMMGGGKGMMDCPMMSGGQGMMGNSADDSGSSKGPWGRSYWAIDRDGVKKVAENFLADLDKGLTVGEVLEFSDHFYVEAVEKDTNIGAYELIVNPSGSKGTVFPNKGPNKMWNVKYSDQGSDVKPQGDEVKPSEMTITKEKAVEYARRYLEVNKLDLTVGDSARPFYGYYNVNVLKGDKVVGLLSVNGYNGRVWYQSWHDDAAPQPQIEKPQPQNVAPQGGGTEQRG